MDTAREIGFAHVAFFFFLSFFFFFSFLKGDKNFKTNRRLLIFFKIFVHWNKVGGNDTETSFSRLAASPAEDERHFPVLIVLTAGRQHSTPSTGSFFSFSPHAGIISGSMS